MITNQCPVCRHYRGIFQCDAFPERIPRDILSGEFDHTEPHEGDNGIQFEPVEADNANRTPPNLD